jgi:hypothetical protein
VLNYGLKLSAWSVSASYAYLSSAMDPSDTETLPASPAAIATGSTRRCKVEESDDGTLSIPRRRLTGKTLRIDLTCNDATATSVAAAAVDNFEDIPKPKRRKANAKTPAKIKPPKDAKPKRSSTISSCKDKAPTQSPAASPDAAADPVDAAATSPAANTSVPGNVFDADGPTRYIDFFIATVLDRLDVADVAILGWYLEFMTTHFGENGIPIGTGCSGSDNIVQWIMGLRRRFADIIICHRFSVEIDADKRAYLFKKFPGLNKVFTQMQILGQQHGINAKTTNLSKAAIDSVFLWIAGFVCKAGSGQNIDMCN